MQKIWMLILLGVVIVLVGVSAFLYGQNQGVSQNGAAKTEGESQNAPSDAPLPTDSLSQAPTQAVASPAVVIEAEAAYPAQDLSEIKARIIAPYLDYKADNQPGELISFKISQNPHPSKAEFPYLADGIFKNGGNEGFVIGKKDGHINWYIPECMNGCNFSESFKAKYPEIVKLAQ